VKNNKTLFAGPFIGEFGMELFTWQGYIRNISREYDRTIISSRKECEFLYKDFYDIFISFDPGSYNCDGYECIDNENIPNLHEKFNPDKVYRSLNLNSYINLFNNIDQKFVSYKSNEKKIKDIDICINARNFVKGAKTKLERNWDIIECEKLVDFLLKNGLSVASVGLSCSSNYIKNTINLMDIDLYYLSNILSYSKVIVGPSAGIMHFASLCECPQVVWGSDHLEKRYKKEWNPFESKVEYLIKNNWDPKYTEIIESINKIL